MTNEKVYDEGESNALVVLGLFFAASPMLMLSPDIQRETIQVIKWASLIILAVAFVITAKICAKGQKNDTPALIGILFMAVAGMFYIGAEIRLDRF